MNTNYDPPLYRTTERTASSAVFQLRASGEDPGRHQKTCRDPDQPLILAPSTSMPAAGTLTVHLVIFPSSSRENLN